MENFDDRYKRKNPFSVPERYFEQLDKRIEQRIEVEKRPQKVRLVTLLKTLCRTCGHFFYWRCLLCRSFYLMRWIRTECWRVMVRR